MSGHDNEIHESGQHKTVVMLSSQLEGILTPPVRARKLRKTISVFAPPSPFEKCKSNAEVLKANMDHTAEIDSAYSNASSLKHCRNYISCVPIMKLSTARSCLDVCDGTDSTKECYSSEFESNTNRENVTWHVPIDQKHHFNSSISNNVDENIEEDMGESDSKFFSRNPSQLSTVLTTQYGNSADGIAETDSKQGVIDSKQGVISRTISMPDLGSDYTELSKTDYAKLLLTLCNDQVSESDTDRINEFILSQTNSENSKMTNPQNYTLHKNSRRVFDERETEEVDSSRTTMAELPETNFTVSRQTSETTHILDAGKEDWDDSQHYITVERNLPSPNPEDYYSAVLLPAIKILEQPISYPSGGRGFGESQSEPVAISQNSAMVDSSPSNFAPRMIQPTPFLNPESSSQNSTAGARELTLPIREIYYSRGILPSKAIPTQTISHVAFPDTYYENKHFNDWGSEEITTLKSSSFGDLSQTPSSVISQEIHQPAQTPNLEDKRWIRNFTADGIETASPTREHPYLSLSLPSKSILAEGKLSLPPKSILAETKSRQTIETLNMYEKSESRKKFDKRRRGHIANLKLPSKADSSENKSFVSHHGISEPAYILNTSENNRSINSQHSVTGEKESAPSVRGHHHSIDFLPLQTVHTHHIPKFVNVHQQKGNGASGVSEQVMAPKSYSMVQSSQSEVPVFSHEISQPTHYFHCGNSISSISENPTIGSREPVSPIGEHNYSFPSFPPARIPTQKSSRQRAKSSHVHYRDGSEKLEGVKSEKIGTSRAFPMVDSSPYNISPITQGLPQTIRNCTVGKRESGHTLGEHNYSILQSPNEMISTGKSSHETTKSLGIFRGIDIGNSHKWKFHQSETPRSSLMESSIAVPPSHLSNPTHGRAAHKRECTSGRGKQFVPIRPKLIPIQTSSNPNHDTAFWATTKTDFLQENEESFRAQVPNYHNYSSSNRNQFSATKISPVIRNSLTRSERKNSLVMPPSQTFSSPRPNFSLVSTNTTVLQPDRESFPSHRYNPYADELFSRHSQNNRAPLPQHYLPLQSLHDASLQRPHIIRDGEIVLNPFYLDTSRNLNIHHNKLGAAVSYAPNMVQPNIGQDQIPGPSNTSVDQRYPEFDHPYIPHQPPMYPRFSNNTFYDEFGSKSPIRNPVPSRNIRYNSRSRAPKKTKRGKTFPNHANKPELNELQISRTEYQDHSKAVQPNTPLILKTYYFFTNQNKKIRPFTEQLGNELGSSKLKVITDEYTKYLAIVEGSTSTFKTLDHVESDPQQNKNTAVQKLGVISTNFTIINEIVRRFFANEAAVVTEDNPLSSFEIKGVNDIPNNSLCQVAANETRTLWSSHVSGNEEESIPLADGSEHRASVFPHNINSQEANQQDINLITLKQTDDKLQLILAIHQEPSVVCSQMGSVIDTLKKEFDSNYTVSLHEVLRIYFMDEESRDELIDIITKLLITEK